MNKISKSIFAFFLASGLFFLAVLGLHGYLGTFSRLMSDEFALFSSFKTLGFIDSYIDLYIKFSGRYSLNLTYNLLAITPVKILPFFTAGLLILWLILMTWAISQLMQAIQFKKNALLSGLMGVIIIYASLDILPNIFQSVYWLPGMFTYVFPLVTITMQVGLMAYFLGKEQPSIKDKALALLAMFFFTVIACGFSETHALVVFLGLLAILFFVFLGLIRGEPSRLAYLKVLLYQSLVGSFVALVIQILSPGTWVRQSHFAPDRNLLSVFYHSVRFTFSFILKIIDYYPFALLVVLTSATLFFIWHRVNTPVSPMIPGKMAGLQRFKMPLILVTGFLLMASGMAPSFYATSLPPLDRTLTIPLFIFILLIVFCGYWMSLVLSRWMATVQKRQRVIYLVLALFLICTGGATYDSYKKLWRFSARMKAYALDWENRQQLIERAKHRGEPEVRVPALRCFPMSTGLDEITTDPNFWVNRMVARYYGVPSVKLIKKSEIVRLKKQKEKGKRKEARG